jgi:hypothetical protein
MNDTLSHSIEHHWLRRRFLQSTAGGLASLAASSLLAAEEANSDGQTPARLPSGSHLQHYHHRPRAKRVIYLFQSGGPSQLDLFDYKPALERLHGEDLPASVRMGQRLTAMSGNQALLPLAQSRFRFQRHGQQGAWVSELLPYTAAVVDKLCIVRSMHTDAINHDPAITFFQSGSELPGRPSIGSWLAYGLGNENQNLPAFVVLVTKNKGGQPLYSRLWGSGFLPSRYQGIQFRSGSEPVLFLNDPPGIDRRLRRELLDATTDLDRLELATQLDPGIEERISQYELAFRLQSSVPEVVDLSQEPQSVLDLYGPQAAEPGTFAANCLLARRLVERGVRFVQLFHQDWDHHGGLPGGLTRECRETDQPAAGLIKDLAQRGLLEDTLVVWGGEFGRTNYCQGKLTPTDYGRDHHPRCFSMWMAGGGVRAGQTYGSTDELGYNVAENPVHVHDLHATMLHLLGIDHQRLTFRYQGRRYRLTDVHGRVIDRLIES